MNTARLAGLWSGSEQWRATVAHLRASVGAVLLTAIALVFAILLAAGMAIWTHQRLTLGRALEAQ